MLWFERTGAWRLIGWRLTPRLVRLSGGRLAAKMPLPAAVLETKDARNGRPHRRMVFYFHDDDAVTIVATKAGLPQDPFWYENALADPDVRLAGQPFRAQPVRDQSDQARLWTLADRYFPPFAAYRALAARAGRAIPILQLTARREKADSR